MIKERISFFRKLEMLIDLVLAALAFYIVYPYALNWAILFFFLGVWLGLLIFLGLYESFRIKRLWDVLLTIWSAACMGIGVFGAGAYLLKLDNLNRWFVIFIFLGAAVLVSVEKIIAMLVFRYLRKKGFNYRHLLIVGTGPRAQEFMNLVRRRGEWGLKIVGLIDEDESLIGQHIHGYPVLGRLKDVADIVHENVIDEVVFIVPRLWLPKIQDVMSFCETEGIRVDVAIDVFDLKFAKAKQTELDGFLLVTFERTPLKLGELFIKSVFDIVVSVILMGFLIPIFVGIAVAIKCTSPGPILFKQTRCGLNGRKFTLYKFRTMVMNAETLLSDLKQHNQMTGPAFKMDNDPRVTPVGKFLRKFSLDELPQLLNVLKRDMSLVGPRPPLPKEVKEYDNWHRRRLKMRPGITCWWQIKGRNNITDFNEWMKLDLYYIDHWSIWNDLRILLQTVPAVFFGVGAK